MENTYWHKQTAGQPLFPDLVWSKPQTKQTAGKLLIIGGNIHGFASPASAFSLATEAGIGSIRILLPDVLQKTVSKLMPEAEFAPSTPSGSFSTQALDSFLEQTAWADGVLLAGDFGRNSETAVLLEKFATKSDSPLTITKDGADYFTRLADPLIKREQVNLVVSLAQLQTLATSAHFNRAFTFDMDLLHMVETLHIFTATFNLSVIVKHHDTLFVSAGGQVSTTKTDLGNEDSWRLPIASRACVWWAQNPTQVFEALTTAVIES